MVDCKSSKPCGLSPRVRGSLRRREAVDHGIRPIPAGAGEPMSLATCARASAAYPRGCGGAFPNGATLDFMAGLSPRVRGSPVAMPNAGSRCGPIPAGAGEPGERRIGVALPAAYPRGCGGATKRKSPRSSDSGLSPRVRGSHGLRRAAAERSRPIPAGAGEPRRDPDAGRARAAYPRGCGGASRHRRSKLRLGGLSPRVRGSRPSAARGD